MELIKYLQKEFGISDDLLEQIDQCCQTKTYHKKQVVLPPDHQSSNVYFVEKGLVRMFYRKAGKDITHYFFPEDTFAAATESTFYQKRSIYGIEAVESATITSIPFAAVERLASHAIPINRLIQFILLQSLMGFSSRLHSLQFESALERYNNLIQRQPDILLRAPLGDIASYLGISQQTLSVIRGIR